MPEERWVRLAGASARALVVALLSVACADDKGTAVGPNLGTAGQTPVGAGTTGLGTGGAGGPTLGSSGAPTAGRAGPAAASSSAGIPSAGVGGALAAGAGGSASASIAGASAAGAPAAGASSAGAPSAGAAGAAPAADPDACDRACLIAVMKSYTDALIARDSTKIKVAANLKYTESGVTAKLGDSVWKTAMSIVDNTVLTFADPVEGNVASQFVFKESASVQKLYQVRLKVVKHEITEIESMVVVSGAQFFNPAGMKVEPVFLQMIEPAKRMTREKLKAQTELYLGYLEGKTSAAMVGFDTACKRYENGTVTANGLTAFQTQSWSFAVTHRILVIDEEAGITWGLFPFQQSDTALVVGEAFKIIDNKIMMIAAVMDYIPAKAWDTK